MKNLEILLESENYSDKMDDEVSKIIDDLLKKNTTIQPIINLIKLLNKISIGSSVNLNFNADITAKVIELINKLQR